MNSIPSILCHADTRITRHVDAIQANLANLRHAMSRILQQISRMSPRMVGIMLGYVLPYTAIVLYGIIRDVVVPIMVLVLVVLIALLTSFLERIKPKYSYRISLIGVNFWVCSLITIAGTTSNVDLRIAVASPYLIFVPIAVRFLFVTFVLYLVEINQIELNIARSRMSAHERLHLASSRVARLMLFMRTCTNMGNIGMMIGIVIISLIAVGSLAVTFQVIESRLHHDLMALFGPA